MFSCFRNYLFGFDAKQFNGQYYGEYRHRFYVEKCNLKVTLHEGKKEIVFEGEDVSFPGRESERATCVIMLDDTSAWLSATGAVVQEVDTVGIFGNKGQSAQVITVNRDGLTRYVYDDYLFKGLFGGYWFANKSRRTYKRV